MQNAMIMCTNLCSNLTSIWIYTSQRLMFNGLESMKYGLEVKETVKILLELNLEL